MSQHFAVPGYNLLRYLRNRELDELYIATFLKTLARSLVLVFIPIYLLTIGFSVRFIALFYLIEFIGMLIATPVGLVLNHKLGVKKTMAAADILFIGYMFSVSVLKQVGGYLVLPTLLFAFAAGLFWAAYHVDFTKSVDRQAEGREISLTKAVVILASALGPLAGSLVIVSSSFASSFYVAAVMTVLAILPLFMTKDIKTPKPQFSWRRLKRADVAEKGWAYVAFGAMQIATETFWPLYIYLALKSVVEVGAVFTVTSLMMIGVVVWFGRRVDRNPKKAITFGVLLHAPSWLIRILAFSPIGVFLLNAYSQLSYHLLDESFEKVVYAEAKQSSDISNYFLFRQIFIALGRFLVCTVVFLTGKIEVGFLFTFIAVPLYLGLREKAQHTV
ncbi:MFS transporter [bacterium]|nr:MFS transporter [bacterium]